jgi:hypothetical protein
MKLNIRTIKTPRLSACFVYPILFLGAAGSACMAQSVGTFTVTGSMITARTGHSATLLVTGKVLIAGGYQADDPFVGVESAELYDPSTATFIATGHMTRSRAGHTATLLPDGAVLLRSKRVRGSIRPVGRNIR